MTIKQKIRFAQVVISLTLFALGSFQLWNAAQVYRELGHIGTSVGILEKLQTARSILHRQEQLLIQLLLWRDDRDRDALRTQGRELERLYGALQDGVSRPPTNGGDGASAELTALLLQQAALVADVEHLLVLLDGGHETAARILLEERIEAGFRDKAYPLVDELIEAQNGAIQLNYHSIIAHASSSAVLTRSVLDEVAQASLTVDYVKSIGATVSDLESQGKELLDFLESADPAQLDEYRFFAHSAQTQLLKLQRIIARQQRAGQQRESADAANIRQLQTLLRTGDSMFAEAINHKYTNVALMDLGTKEQQAHDFFELRIFPLLAVLAADARTKLAEAHEHLLSATFLATAGWVVVLIASLLGLIAVTLRVGNHALNSLAILGNGAQRITRGDLNFRIELPKQDEFGELSDQFNRMTQALQDTQGELSRFVYITSHDLRAPLISIQGFSYELHQSNEALQTLLSTDRGALAPEQRQQLEDILANRIPEALGFIDAAAERLGSQINSILKLCREGKREFFAVPVDLNEVVSQLTASMAHQLAEKNVTLGIEPLPEVFSDQEAAEQILGNLIDNAIKYLDRDRPGNIRISATRRDNDALIRVEDNGQGIAEQDRERIFEIFQRAAPGDVPGEGMGLAYVKALIKRQGGEIWCDSTPGAGSTFSFTLPLAKPREAAPKDTA